MKGKGNAGRPSKTAEAVAAVRARHFMRDEPKVFRDPWAISLTSATWRIVCRSRLLSWIVFDRVLGALRPIQATILARARYVEEKLSLAASRHIVDYVILGAGFDSFALRQGPLIDSLRVWEIDHPDTQRCKRRRLAAMGAWAPSNVHFIEADFCDGPLDDLLSGKGLDAQASVFFSMLGLSYYLPRDTVIRLVDAIGRRFGAGTELVIDIRVDAGFIAPEDRASFHKLERFTARRGEVMTTHFAPDSFTALCEEAGLDLVECVSPAQQKARYFAERDDGLAPSPDVYLLHFRKA